MDQIFLDNTPTNLQHPNFMMGIDEAGRGCVIGPLVMCAVIFPISKEWELKQWGVKDSKLLSRSVREKLAIQIKNTASWFALEFVPASKIDEACLRHQLDFLEAQTTVDLIQKQLTIEDKDVIIYIDSPGNPKKYQQHLNRAWMEEKTNSTIVAENKADIRYPVVSAASILAKVYRDQAITELHNLYGNFGSGYPGDAKTIYFLQNMYASNGRLPDCVRHTWKTIENRIYGNQRKLFE